MKALLLNIIILIPYIGVSQCKIGWANWTAQNDNFKLTSRINLPNDTVSISLKANYVLGLTSGIYKYFNFNNFSRKPINSHCPRIDFIQTGTGRTVIKFSKKVYNPFLLFSSLGRPNNPVKLIFNHKFKVNYNEGGLTTHSDSSLTGREGNFVINFPNYLDSIVFSASDYEYYTNLTVGLPEIKKYSKNRSLCKGDSLFEGNTFYTNTGSYTFVYNLNAECDSLVTTNLLVNDTFNIFSRKTICQGDSVVEGNSVYKTSGTYLDRYQSRFGCDSTIKTILQVIDTTFYTQSQTICYGRSLQVADTAYSTSGTFKRKTKTRFGCDSIITTTITIAYPDTSYLDSAKCQGQTAKIGINTFGNTGLYKEVLTNRRGCDSVVFLNLKIIEPVNGFRSFTVCEGDTVFDAGKTFTAEGSFPTTLTAKSTKCDSIHTTEVKHIKLRIVTNPNSDTTIKYEQTLEINAFAIGENLRYKWEPKEMVDCDICSQTKTKPIHKNIIFTAFVTDTIFNCTAEKSFKVLVNCPISVPNLVTPNGDNANDFLYLKRLECIANIASFKVFNRWGKELIPHIDLSTPQGISLWRPEEPGIYFYQLEVNIVDSEPQKFKGWIQVVK